MGFTCGSVNRRKHTLLPCGAPLWHTTTSGAATPILPPELQLTTAPTLPPELQPATTAYIFPLQTESEIIEKKYISNISTHKSHIKPCSATKASNGTKKM